jgi:hypothetical protein
MNERTNERTNERKANSFLCKCCSGGGGGCVLIMQLKFAKGGRPLISSSSIETRENKEVCNSVPSDDPALVGGISAALTGYSRTQFGGRDNLPVYQFTT